MTVSAEAQPLSPDEVHQTDVTLVPEPTATDILASDAFVDFMWSARRTERNTVEAKQRQIASIAIENWYWQDAESLKVNERQLKREIELGRAGQRAYEQEVRVAEREWGALTPEKMAGYFGGNIGQYATYDDLAPLAMGLGGVNKANSARSILSTMLNQRSVEPYLEEDGVVLHHASYQLMGKGRPRSVFVALPADEEPQWPLGRRAETESSLKAGKHVFSF